MGKSGKGSEFERTICKQLSLWWTQDQAQPRDDIFWRTSQSGGRATTRRKSNITTAYSSGDVTFIDPIGQPLIDYFLIELKRGYTYQINPLDFVDWKTGSILLKQWWEKAEAEKEQSGRRFSLLIFRRNRRFSCVAMENSLFGILESYFGKMKEKEPEINLKTGVYSIVILRFETFLSWADSSFFIEEAKE